MRSEKEMYGYLYTYFRGDIDGSGVESQHIHAALSKNGMYWHALNGNEPILLSTKGTKGTRDPHIFRSRVNGRFYIIGTDLDSNEGKWEEYSKNGSLNIVVWESEDLIHWSEQKLVKLALDGTCFLWAPTVCYQEEENAYYVFFAAASRKHPGKCIYVASTQDFLAYSEPTVFKEVEGNIDEVKDLGSEQVSPYITFIDTTIYPYSGKYYHFTKREQDVTVRMEVSDSMLCNYKVVKHIIGDEYGVEGPAIFQLIGQEKWCLMLDGYCGPNNKVGYIPFIADSKDDLDKANFRRLRKEEFQLPQGAKHGSFIPITKEEYDKLVEKWGL
jgi:hypothetical protein